MVSRARLSAAVVTVGLVIAGCSSPGGPATVEPPGQAQPYQGASQAPAAGSQGAQDEAPTTRTLPLDAFIFERPGVVSADTRAQWVLAQQCAQRFGLTFSPPQPDLTPRGLWDRPLGVESEVEARTWGYHQEPDDEVEENYSADLSAVLFGHRDGQEVATFAGQAVPDGGCFGEARRKLADELPPADDEQYALKLATKAVAEADGDARLRKAYATWSRCMKDAGYDYASPREAMQDERFRPAAGSLVAPAPGKAADDRGTPPPPSALEIATALADVGCKKESALLGVWVRVVTEYQQREVDDHAAALAELKAALEARYKRAAEIVNGG